MKNPNLRLRNLAFRSFQFATLFRDLPGACSRLTKPIGHREQEQAHAGDEHDR